MVVAANPAAAAKGTVRTRQQQHEHEHEGRISLTSSHDEILAVSDEKDDDIDENYWMMM